MTQQSGQWLSDSVRLTLFFSTPVSNSVVEDWIALALDPDVLQFATRHSSGIEHRVIASLPDDERLEIVSYGFRLDVFLGSTRPRVENFPLNLWGDTVGALKRLDELSRPIQDAAQESLIRLALGGRCFLPAPSAKDGYLQLNKMLHFVELDAEKMQDFTLQVNIRSESKIDGIEYLNRITKWASVEVKMGSDILTPNSGSSWWATFAELDINTPAERTTPLSSDQIHQVMDEIIAHSKQILSEGTKCMTS